MIIIDNLQRLLFKLRAMTAQAARDNGAAARVSYSTYYAVWVHENLNSHHPIGQAKFLEQPARMYTREITEAARIVFRQKFQVRPALLAAAQTLLTLSKPLVPVDTGALKASGKARLE